MIEQQTPLLEVRPSWWSFFWHLFFFWLIVPPIIAIVRRHSLVLRVFDDRVSLELGLVNKQVSDVFITDITEIQVNQGFWQRLFGLGDLEIGTSAVEGWEEAACGLPDAMAIRDLILAQRRALAGHSPPSK
jgi:uncharacterized membrane protein YdbT with pleckstrin-like domain